ncbi:MAG: hypothetical protein JJ863_19495 [Deltaproteobacteria bacterium]|nr:hypothetical protein [Deltaproteobacteria bacterium]
MDPADLALGHLRETLVGRNGQLRRDLVLKEADPPGGGALLDLSEPDAQRPRTGTDARLCRTPRVLLPEHLTRGRAYQVAPLDARRCTRRRQPLAAHFDQLALVQGLRVRGACSGPNGPRSDSPPRLIGRHLLTKIPGQPGRTVQDASHQIHVTLHQPSA